MKAVVNPQKGGYKVLFHEGAQISGVALLSLEETPKGPRPVHYRIRWGGRRQYRATPSRDLVSLLRRCEVTLTRPDTQFEAFLVSFQIPFDHADICRVCLLEDRITPLSDDTAVAYGKKDRICFPCARRELRRELAHMGRIGKLAMSRLDELLKRHRNIDQVLASILPESRKLPEALFDRLEAHEAGTTSRIEELPLPRSFTDACGITTLMPAQQLAVDSGLLHGKSLLVVSATASGKTFIGEMAGLKNYLEGRGRVLFLVPLVALAVQKYLRFSERYGRIAGTGILIGKSRLHLPENRPIGDRNSHAPVLVGTYEGVDHLLRCGMSLGAIGTVIVDEVQMLEDPDRGHRLDGLIARLKYLAPKAQFLYLSATIGAPKVLAGKLGSTLVTYASRPVPLERYLLFVDKKQKIPTIKRLSGDEYVRISSKGYHGQSIIFSHSRARCQVIADALGPRFAAYHAGLTSQERRDIEAKFLGGSLTGVVTTAALGAGVDFPASQVIFDSLAMGISWLTVQEFNQMAGRAGRPDFHDLGKVVVLAEPGASYARGSRFTEEEMAMRLLKGEMEEVAPVFDLEASSEEYVAHAVVCGGKELDTDRISAAMVGDYEPSRDVLAGHAIIRKSGDRIILTDRARVMAEHFIGMERLLEIEYLARKTDDPIAILTELDYRDQRDDRAGKKDEAKGKTRR